MANATIRVTCSHCKKKSEIMTPADDHGPVIWACPQQKADGDLCGASNTVNA